MPKKAKASSGGAEPAPKSGPSYWLFKTEADEHSWEMQKSRGKKGEPWEGVRNFRARNNMTAMRLGDLGFFYHSQEGKEIVGVAEVIREHYIDPTDPKGVFVCVDVKAVKPLARPFTLAEAKADPKLKDMSLVTSFRLSVQPVTEVEWDHISERSGL